MFDDLAAYYHENVVAAFITYRKISNEEVAGQSRDLREAIDAATALFHLREHLPKPSKLTRSDVEKQCSDYGLLGDIANAAKHKKINQVTPHGPPLVDSAESIQEKLLLIQYEDTGGKYWCTKKTVVAKLVDGSERSLLEILTNVLNFWEEYLHSIGVLSEKRSFRYETPIRYRSRAECEQMRLDFKLVRGHRFQQHMQLLRFDEKTGTATPVDLTGSKLKFRIFKPRFECEISFQHEATGTLLKRPVQLTDEECAGLAALASEEEKRTYLNSLPRSQEALKELIAEVRKLTDLSTNGGGI